MEEKQNVKNHKVNLLNRSVGSLTGIKDVISFDLKEILLETEQGMLLIKGNDLHVTRLTVEKGEVEIDGRIDSFTYSDVNVGIKSENGLLNKLFK